MRIATRDLDVPSGSGFCPKCGSALCWQRVGADKIDLLVGSLDDPQRVQPREHLWASQALRCGDCEAEPTAQAVQVVLAVPAANEPDAQGRQRERPPTAA